MADDKFFEETQETTEDTQEANAPELFKVGEKEYSQDDLAKLVGLGEIAREAEEKWNTPIKKVFPEYTKATQELKALKEAQEQARQNPAPQQNFNQQGQLTEEQKAEARRQLADLGFSDDKYREIVRQELAAKDLIADVSGVVSQNKEAGNPAVTSQELLEHMQETGIKNPTKAYKDLFENELDAIKEKKLSTIKGNGMVTTEASTAGSKNPAPIKVTKANLAQLINEGLTSFGGSN